MIGVQSHTLDGSAKPSLWHPLGAAGTWSQGEGFEPRNALKCQLITKSTLEMLFYLGTGLVSYSFYFMAVQGQNLSQIQPQLRYTSDKNHLGNAISLGNGIGPVLFISRQSNARILSSADISEHSLDQNLPTSSMFPRHPKGATGKASLTHPKYDFGHLSYLFSFIIVQLP